MNGNEYNHHKKNKELTKRRFINAVGEIIREKGYFALKLNEIARKAGADKKLVYRYFGGLNQLIEAYVLEKDYWMSYSKFIREQIGELKPASYADLVNSILENQFEYFYSERELQKIISWEISQASDLMRSISNVRESLGEEIFDLIEPGFNGSKVNIRAVSALLVAGIYYLVLHAKNNGSTFCGIDIKEVEGRSQIVEAINTIVNAMFEKAGFLKK